MTSNANRDAPPWHRDEPAYMGELRALLRDGYACRRCKAAVVSDDTRRIVMVDKRGSRDVANLLTLCIRCAAAHDGGK